MGGDDLFFVASLGRKLNYEDYESFSLARFLACAARVLDRAATRLLA